MPEGELNRAFDESVRCDLFLMIGSSLQVEPAASLPRAAHRKGAALVYVNRTPTPTDSMARIIFREPAGEVLDGIVRAIP